MRAAGVSITHICATTGWGNFKTACTGGDGRRAEEASLRLFSQMSHLNHGRLRLSVTDRNLCSDFTRERKRGSGAA